MADRRREDDDERGSRRRERDDDDRGSRRRSSEDDEPRGRSRDRDDDDRGSRRRGDDDGGSSGYRYERRDAESVKRRAEQRGSGGDFDRLLKEGVKMWKPNDGDNRIRILPPTWKKPEHFGLDVSVHYGVGADRQSYLCLHKHKGEPDPIHEAYEEARRELNDNEGDKALEQLVKDLKAKKRVVYYLVDRDHEKEGIQAWAAPKGFDDDLVQVMQDKRTGEVLPIDDPEDGYDIEFTKKGQGIKTEYTGIAVARRSSPLDNPKALKFAVENPLPDQLQFFSYEHIAKVFGGGGKRRRDDDRDEDRGSRDRDERDSPRSRDRDDDRGRGREREEERGGRSSRDDEPTWESVHDLTRSEMIDLIEEKDLDIKPKEAKDDEDLADWICEELKLKKPKKEERKRDSDDGEDKLAAMRRRREERD